MTRLLLSLPELELRVSWLKDHFERWPAQTVAGRLDELCAQSERSEPSARQALLAVACYFTAEGDSALVRELRTIAEETRLLSLARMLCWGRVRSASTPPVAQGTRRSQEIPDYGTGRELTVGERRTLARRPSRGHIEKMLADPHPLVLRALLQNPYLVEADVLRLAARRPAHVAALHALARAPQWLCKGRIRMAIVQNPGTPAHIAGPLLVICNRAELFQVVGNTTVPAGLRATAQELLARRPPFTGADAADRVLQ
jgi:hypothetical protein